MCLDVGITKTNGRSLRKSFEVMNEMFIFNNFFAFKLSIRVVALSSLYSKLRFSPVAPYPNRIIEGAFKTLIGNKMLKYERAILVLRLSTCKE